MLKTAKRIMGFENEFPVIIFLPFLMGQSMTMKRRSSHGPQETSDFCHRCSLGRLLVHGSGWLAHWHYEYAKTVFKRLEKALRLYLAFHKNLADFEIKGQFSYMKNYQYHWAPFGKLPLATEGFNPVHKPVIRSGSPSPVNLVFSDQVSDPNSFNRMRNALLRYSRYLKRVPFLDEALSLIKNHHLFTGSWDENESKREIRVDGTLEFFAQTFDPSKCGNGCVNIGKYDEWARNKYPDGLKIRKRRVFNFTAEWVERIVCPKISPEFISVFMSITEFCILMDKNRDNSFPHHRADKLWESLYEKGLVSVKFNNRKWARRREEMDKAEIVAIVNEYGKQWQWAFPADRMVEEPDPHHRDYTLDSLEKDLTFIGRALKDLDFDGWLFAVLA